MKKSWLFIVFAIALGLLVFILIQVNRLKTYDHNDDSLKAIPANAGVIIKARSLDLLQKKLNEEINFKDDLFSSNLIRNALLPLNEVDSFATTNKLPISHIKKHVVYISFHSEGKQSVKPFYLIELHNKKEATEIKGAIESFSSNLYDISKRKYNYFDLYQLKNKTNSHSIFVSITNGLALLSESSLLVEASLRQLSANEDWSQSSAFENVRKTASAASKINLFVNFKTLPDILQAITDPQYTNQVNLIKDQSDWAELDVDIKDDGILLNGFINGTHKGVYAYLIQDTKAQRNSFLEYLPSNTRAYLSIVLDNSSAFQKRINSFYKTNNIQYPITNFEDKHSINFQDPFFAILSGELTLAIDASSRSNSSLLLMGLESKSEGEETLKTLLNKTGNTTTPTRVYKPDDGISYNIYKGFSEPVFDMLFGALMDHIPNSYFTFYENNLIVADTYMQLEQLIYNNILNRTLKYNKTHQKFLENFSSRDNVFVYANMEALPQSTENLFTPLWENINTKQKESLSNFYAIGFQFSSMGAMGYSTIYLQHLPNKVSEPHTIWQSLLDSLAITKPTLVNNHYTNEKEVIIQDAENNLYLMSNNGRMLWKKPLDAPILSEITQIDYYNNNKLQYIFNTKNRIYILDRNGNNVAHFPVNLPSSATNGLSVFDYDNNKDYRFFVACENKQVYLFNKKGNIVQGWEFKKSEGNVNKPLQHFRTAGKDYIVLSDNRRNYILDRKGNIRVPIKTDFVRNSNSVFYLSTNAKNESELITSSTNGEIVKVSLNNGAVKIYSIGTVDPSHKLTYEKVNGKDRYIISEPHKVTVLDNQFKTVFSKTFDNQINLNIDTYQFSSQNIKFGISEQTGNNIYLLNDDGSTYKGFPLIGKSRFSIGFLKSSSTKFNLIVAGANNYLYNYRVE